VNTPGLESTLKDRGGDGTTAPHRGVLPLPGQAPPPSRIGNYEIERELARGGMGVVYVARHVELQRRVALKVLLTSTLPDPEDVERFQIEARAAARLQHPGIVGIHEVGRDGERWFLAMDLVEGCSLHTRLSDSGPFLPRDAAGLIEQVARALHYAHTRAILHRDLKPHNVLLDHQGRALLTDFGLAKEVEGSQQITVTGQVLGTPAYMSPEQAVGDPARVDRRSDVYGLGATLYALLTGQPPFQGPTVLNVLQRVLEVEPQPPSRVRPAEVGPLDRDLETICLTCLAKEPSARYDTAGALADDLARYLRHEPVQARTPTWRDRGAKWLRRNRLLVGTIAGVGLAALTATLVVSVHQRGEALAALRREELAKGELQDALVEVTAARADAQEQAQAARAREEIALRALQRVTSYLNTVSDPNARVRDVRADLTDAALQAMAEIRDAQALEGERYSLQMAELEANLGSLVLDAGRSEEALGPLQRGVDLALQVLASSTASEADRAQAHRVHVTCSLAQERVFFQRGDLDRAASSLTEAETHLGLLPPEEAGVTTWRVEAALAWAALHRERGQHAESEVKAREALELARDSDPQLQVEILVALGDARQAQGNSIDAYEAWQQALDTVSPDQAGDAWYKLMDRTANAQGDGAEDALRLAIDRGHEEHRRDPERRATTLGLAMSLTALGQRLLRERRFGEVRSLADAAAAHAEDLEARGGESRDSGLCLIDALVLRALAAQAEGDLAQAEQTLERALGRAKTLDPDATASRRKQLEVLAQLCHLYLAGRNLLKAEELSMARVGLAREWVASSPGAQTPSLALARSLAQAAEIALLLGFPLDAETMVAEALSWFPQRGADLGQAELRRHVARALLLQGRTLLNLGRAEQAQASFTAGHEAFLAALEQAPRFRSGLRAFESGLENGERGLQLARGTRPPASPDEYALLGLIRLQEGDPQAAFQSFQQFLRHPGQRSPYVLLQAAYAASRVRAEPEATLWLEACIRMHVAWRREVEQAAARGAISAEYHALHEHAHAIWVERLEHDPDLGPLLTQDRLQPLLAELR
jgi:Protein kinase domain